jgi:hypothetical protein
MIEHVEEVRAEAEILSFRSLEEFFQGKVHILLRGPDKAVARRVPADRGVAGSSCGKWSEWVRPISHRVHRVSQPGVNAVRTGCISATERRAEGGGRRWTRQLVCGPSRRIKDGEGCARLQNDRLPLERPRNLHSNWYKTLKTTIISRAQTFGLCGPNQSRPHRHCLWNRLPECGHG